MKPKIKVGFYLENKRFPHVDLRVPEKGNPGMGGTQFTTVATAYYLNKFYSDRLNILLLANLTELLPPSLNVCQADSDIDAAIKSEQQGCDIFVFRSREGDHPIYDQLPQLKVKTISRSNNTPDIVALKRIADCPQIKCHVCVGQEQLDLLRDHRVFEKSIRIFNPFNIESFVPQKEIAKQGNTVVFLGSIIPSKGFHYLARVWPYILKKRPDAKLIVIGSGKLYDRNQVLGKWGVAEEHYEANCIRPFLSDENGNIMESVHFAGVLGEEKIPILQRADVGVVNPSGRTEVCPASALEIQASGTPVVSGAKEGMPDTVVHKKTGLLGNTDRELARNILYLLNNPDIAKQMGDNGINFVQNNFSPELITQQWLSLFSCIYEGKLPEPQPIKSNYFYQAKVFREGLRRLKQAMPLLQGVPALIEIKPLLKRYIKKRS
ncbi:MAG TPA: glycosyl transferase family 1 [Cyanobacteria bacterium UBA8803]|nr:glycosyl transferase family 1 [Cyanobacteria bacterium UBA9273]HBL62823.1 glycosyl transferase family 1 [Cyanobacteria bacterium UBA8803]